MVVESSQTEYGPAQFELNVGPTDPLRAADDVLFLKHVVKETACRHGARATFMPAPYQGESFSGFHLHQSLRARDGARAWEDGAEPASLRRYLAGLLRRVGELSAVMSPSINAYKRSADYTFAANRVCWGKDNRSVAVRALDLGGPGARLEARTASSDANPYLVIAGCLAAGAEGIEQALEPPAAVTGDAYADASLARLPDSLAAAVELLETSEFCRAVLGEEPWPRSRRSSGSSCGASPSTSPTGSARATSSARRRPLRPRTTRNPARQRNRRVDEA
jgi:glutamine synthetase